MISLQERLRMMRQMQLLQPTLQGRFGTAGDQEADDFCIKQLLPNKLKDQYCFKTESAIECLKFVKGEKIWLK